MPDCTCFQSNTTSLAEDDSACKSTLNEMRAALRTRRRYSSDPVLASDVEQLVSISIRWVDECPPVTVTVRHRDHLDGILSVADLVFGHSADVLSQSARLYRSRRFVVSCFWVVCNGSDLWHLW